MVSKSHRKRKKGLSPPRIEEVLDCLQCNWRQVAAGDIKKSAYDHRKYMTEQEEFGNKPGCVNGEDSLPCGGREV